MSIFDSIVHVNFIKKCFRLKCANSIKASLTFGFFQCTLSHTDLSHLYVTAFHFIAYLYVKEVEVLGISNYTNKNSCTRAVKITDINPN